MIADDFELDPDDVVQWDAIVSSEWPDEKAVMSTQVDLALTSPGESIAPAEQQVLTIYRPTRPALGLLATAVVAAFVCAWVIIMHLAPAYQLATARGVSHHERADAINQLPVVAVLVAVTLALTLGFVAAWIVIYARYSLRRSSYDQVTRQATPITRNVRPPNPATAAAWILLLLSTSGAVGWWIPLQLERASGSGSDPVVPTQWAALAALAWLVVCVLSAAGLASCAAREARHQLRRRAVGAAPSHRS